jgi:hypothetical protein
MSLGIPVVAPLPTPGVTASPTFEAELIAWCQEIEAKLEAKVNQADITLTSGDITKHAARPVELPAAAGVGVTATYDAANGYWSAAGAGNTVTVELPMQPGQRLTSVSVHGRNSGVAWTAQVVRIAKGSGTITALGAVMTSGTSAGTIEKLTRALTTVAADDEAFFVRWTAGGAGDRFLGARFEVDRP